MRVGITYDLRDDYLAMGLGEEEIAEFDRPDTIDAIDRTLHDLGYTTDRIGQSEKPDRHAWSGVIAGISFSTSPKDWQGYGREAQVPALLDAYQIPYTFSDPLALTLTLHKGMAKHVVRGSGVPTPDFVVVEDRTGSERGRPAFSALCQTRGRRHR